MTPVEWLEKDYNHLFHENNRLSMRVDSAFPELVYYAYPRPYHHGAGSGAYTPLFSIKKDDTPYEQLFSRPVNVVG